MPPAAWLQLNAVSIDDLFLPFSHEIYHGERVGLIGPNGTGKTHLLNALHGTLAPDHGTIVFGPRTLGRDVHAGQRPAGVPRPPVPRHRPRPPLRRGARDEGARPVPDRPAVAPGQKARLEILCLELDGHNVLLLDEPTDNLDVESSEALEQALDGFEGTVIAVSHDRTFLAQLDRFVMITDDGEVFAIPDYELAMQALADPPRARTLRLVQPLT